MSWQDICAVFGPEIPGFEGFSGFSKGWHAS
jgi:hypothetical protein